MYAVINRSSFTTNHGVTTMRNKVFALCTILVVTLLSGYSNAQSNLVWTQTEPGVWETKSTFNALEFKIFLNQNDVGEITYKLLTLCDNSEIDKGVVLERYETLSWKEGQERVQVITCSGRPRSGTMNPAIEELIGLPPGVTRAAIAQN